MYFAVEAMRANQKIARQRGIRKRDNWLYENYPLFAMVAEAFSLARLLLLCSIPALGLFAPMSNTLPFILRAVGDSAYPSFVSLGVLWGVSIALGYVFAIPMGIGLWGIWIAQWLSWGVRSMLFYLRFWYKRKSIAV